MVFGRLFWRRVQAGRDAGYLFRGGLPLPPGHPPGRHGYPRRERRLPAADPHHREHPLPHQVRKGPADFHGCSGIGCISDTDPQPLLVRSHLGLYAITTVGIINNAEELVEQYFSDHGHQFMAMSSGKVNATELTAALINQCDDLVSGIRHAQEVIDGSCTMLILTDREASSPPGTPGPPARAGGPGRGRLLRLLRVLRLPQAGLPRRLRAGPPGDRPGHPRRLGDPLPRRGRDAHLRLPVDLLRLPQLQLRGGQRGGHALPQRRDHGPGRDPQGQAAQGGLCGRRARLRRPPRHRLRQPQRQALRPALCQVHPHLAPVLHARQTRRSATRWPR